MLIYSLKPGAIIIGPHYGCSLLLVVVTWRDRGSSNLLGVSGGDPCLYLLKDKLCNYKINAQIDTKTGRYYYQIAIINI